MFTIENTETKVKHTEATALEMVNYITSNAKLAVNRKSKFLEWLQKAQPGDKLESGKLSLYCHSNSSDEPRKQCLADRVFRIMGIRNYTVVTKGYIKSWEAPLGNKTIMFKIREDTYSLLLLRSSDLRSVIKEEETNSETYLLKTAKSFLTQREPVNKSKKYERIVKSIDKLPIGGKYDIVLCSVWTITIIKVDTENVKIQVSCEYANGEYHFSPCIMYEHNGGLRMYMGFKVTKTVERNLVSLYNTLKSAGYTFYIS